MSDPVPVSEAPKITLDTLAPRPIWVGWQTESRAGGKPTKVPYCPSNGRKAEADNPHTWASRESARVCADRLPKPYGIGGVGLQLADLGDGRSIGGIDLDSCREKETGKIEHWAQEIIDHFQTYTEVSPSGTGAKSFFVYHNDDLPVLRDAMAGSAWGKTWKRGNNGDHPPAIELYLGRRYFAVTEQHLAGTASDLRTVSSDNLLWLISSAGPVFVGQRASEPRGGADQSRSARAMRRGVELRRRGVTYEEMVEALRADADPGIVDWVREKGEARDERELKRIWTKGSIDPEIVLVNETYALVLIGGQAVVMKEGVAPDGGTDIGLLAPSAFKAWFGNRHIQVGRSKKTLADYWLGHPERRQYEGIIFSPGGDVPGYFNLWRGLAVEARPGDWSKFKAHLLDNVCRSDQNLFLWVFAWFAEIVQHPAKKIGTSLVIRGKEGTGKTKVGEYIGPIFGSHYLAVSDPRYITGHFNSHMASVLLLHGEEAFWAGDHAAEGKLKDLITGDTHLIEYKGKEPIRVRNYTRLFVTGNPDWVVPVSLEGRRFAVLEIGEAEMQNGAYFAEIDREMNAGGREALLYDLKHFDLTTVNLREIPKTASLLDQKIQSLRPDHGWWLDVLQKGRLPWGCDEAGKCPTEKLFDDYVLHAQKVGARNRALETRLGIFLKKIVPGLQKYEGTYRGFNGRATSGMVYEFPSLAACRDAFTTQVKQTIPWDGPEEWLAEPEPAQADF